MMYEILDQLRTFEPLALNPFQSIKDFMARIEVRYKDAMMPIFWSMNETISESKNQRVTYNGTKVITTTNQGEGKSHKEPMEN